MAALLEELSSGFDADQTAAHNANPLAAGAWTRAYVTATATPSQDTSAHVASVALLAAVGYDRTLLEPIQERDRSMGRPLDDDGLPGVDAHVVRLAADGLCAADLFGLAPPGPELRVRIHARLAELATASDGQRP